MLIELLNGLAKELKTKYQYIDCGGCCVVAAHVAKYLSQLVPTQIVAGNSYLVDATDLTELRNDVHDRNSKRAWEDNGVDFAHVLIEFEYEGKTYAFDSTNGVVPADEMWAECLIWNRLDGHFEQEEAESFANECSWNSMFDRSYVPFVRSKITKFFKKNFSELRC